MNKKVIQVVCLDLFLICLIICARVMGKEVPLKEIQVKITYGEWHENRDGGMSQLFWSDDPDIWSEECSLMDNINEGNNAVTFQMPDIDLNTNYFRLDPFMKEEPFSIETVEFLYDEKVFYSLPAERFEEYVEKGNTANITKRKIAISRSQKIRF